MIVGGPGGECEAAHHRKDEDEEAGQGPQPDEQRQKGEGKGSTPNEGALMFGVFFSHLIGAIERSRRDGERILNDSHLRAVLASPRTLVLRLIQEVEMMTQVVMQDPQVGGDP